MEYLADLESAIGALQTSGKVILAGDFNAHLSQSDPLSDRERLLHTCIHRYNLYTVSTSSTASGPNYTFFSSTTHSMVDFILTEYLLAGQVLSCKIHQHHLLNLSDHLPISVTLALQSFVLPTSSTGTTRSINWARAVEHGDVHVFADQVSQLVSPFIHSEHQTVSELQGEITYICKEIINIATRYLPHKKAKKKKSIVKDEQLHKLCKSSR